MLRRFRDASRLVVTVASIGLAQVLGGIEVVGSKALDFVGLTGAFEVRLDLQLDLGVKRLGGDEMLIVLVAPDRARRRWPGSCCGPTTAPRCGPPPRTPTGPCSSASPCAATPRSCGCWPAAWPPSAFILKAPFTGFAPGVATTGPAVLLPGAGRRGGGPDGVAARRPRRRHRARRSSSRWPGGTRAARRRSSTPLFVVVIVAALLVPRAARSAVREQAHVVVVRGRHRSARSPNSSAGCRRCGPRSPAAWPCSRSLAVVVPRTLVGQQPAPRQLRPRVGDGRRVARGPHRVGRQHQPRPVRARRGRRPGGRQPHRRPEPRPHLRAGAGRRGGALRWRW